MNNELKQILDSEELATKDNPIEDNDVRTKLLDKYRERFNNLHKGVKPQSPENTQM